MDIENRLIKFMREGKRNMGAHRGSGGVRSRRPFAHPKGQAPVDTPSNNI